MLFSFAISPAASVSLWVVLRPALGQVTLHKFASLFPRPACGCSKTTRRSLPSFPAPSQPLSKNPFVIFPIAEETSSENNAGPFPELKTSSFAGLGWACAGRFPKSTWSSRVDGFRHLVLCLSLDSVLVLLSCCPHTVFSCSF